MRKFFILKPDKDYSLPGSLCPCCFGKWSMLKEIIFSGQQSKETSWEQWAEEKKFCETCKEIVLLFAERGFPRKNPDWPFPLGNKI